MTTRWILLASLLATATAAAQGPDMQPAPDPAPAPDMQPAAPDMQPVPDPAPAGMQPPQPAPDPAPQPHPVAPDPDDEPRDLDLQIDTQLQVDIDPGAADEDPPLPDANRPQLNVTVQSEGDLETGSVFTLVLTADALSADDVAVPPDQDLAPFEILDRRARVEERGDRAVHTFELDLLALEPGEHEVPALRLRVVTADGAVGEVTTEPQTVEVASVLGNEPDAQPRPATQPVQVFEEDDTLYWVLGALGLILVTALLTLLFARWWRRREKKAAPPPPPRPAWEIAIEKLEALRQSRGEAVEEGHVVEWVDGVSDAVREYLGNRYEFDGLESTTDEVVAILSKKKLVAISAEEVRGLLGDCDLVKFAKAEFDDEQSEQLLAGAFRIVRATSPRPGAPPPSSTPARPKPSAPQQPAAPAPAPDPDDPDARWMPKPTPAVDPHAETARADGPSPQPVTPGLDTVAPTPEKRDIPQTQEGPQVAAGHDTLLDGRPMLRAGEDPKKSTFVGVPDPAERDARKLEGSSLGEDVSSDDEDDAPHDQGGAS